MENQDFKIYDFSPLRRAQALIPAMSDVIFKLNLELLDVVTTQLKEIEQQIPKSLIKNYYEIEELFQLLESFSEIQKRVFLNEHYEESIRNARKHLRSFISINKPE